MLELLLFFVWEIGFHNPQAYFPPAQLIYHVYFLFLLQYDIGRLSRELESCIRWGVRGTIWNMNKNNI